ncbi:MAG: hypothetical protein ACLR2G_03415 [Phascolarctobacterium faecium]
MIGFGVDVLQYYHAVPLIENYWLGIIVMFLGQFSISLGTYFISVPDLALVRAIL